MFVQNLFHSFLKAKSTQGKSDDSDFEELSPDQGTTGTDLFGFVKQITSSVVGGVVSIVLNASLGFLGGLSQGSSTLFAGSLRTTPQT